MGDAYDFLRNMTEDETEEYYRKKHETERQIRKEREAETRRIHEAADALGILPGKYLGLLTKVKTYRLVTRPDYFSREDFKHIATDHRLHEEMYGG